MEACLRGARRARRSQRPGRRRRGRRAGRRCRAWCVRIHSAPRPRTRRDRPGPALNVDGNRVRVRDGKGGDPIRISLGSARFRASSGASRPCPRSPGGLQLDACTRRLDERSVRLSRVARSSPPTTSAGPAGRPPQLHLEEASHGGRSPGIQRHGALVFTTSRNPLNTARNGCPRWSASSRTSIRDGATDARSSSDTSDGSACRHRLLTHRPSLPAGRSITAC